jgi:hypothetical protein
MPIILAWGATMKDVYDLLKQKEAQLELLARQVQALRVTAELMAQEQKLLGEKEEPKSPSQPQMAYGVLSEKGEPMHVARIADGIRKKFGKRLKPTYLTSVLYRSVKKGKLF